MDLGEMGGGSRKGNRGLRLVESIQFANGSNDNDEDDDDLSIPFVRSIPLGANVDVDAVDGSYSLDDAIQSPSAGGDGGESSPSLLPLLPPSLLVGAMDPTSIRFVVEHTLATSETERCRCFFLYGDAASGNGDGSSSSQEENDEEEIMGDDDDDDFAIMAAKKAKEISISRRKESEITTSDGSETNYRLLGVILAEETKVMPKQDQTTEEDESAGNETDDEDYAAEFISQMIETAPRSEDDQMSRLMESLDKHNQRVLDSATTNAGGGTTSDGVANNETMERHSLGMFGLTSGAWLGDTFVRETTSSPSSASARPSPSSSSARSQPKGFGKKSTPPTSSDDNDEKESGRGAASGDRFATWNQGVQKIALRFEWDYGEFVSQSYTYGKFMGASTSASSMANIKSDGIVVINESSSRRSRRLRGKESEERRVVWDMGGGAYVAGLIGSRYFRAPRYMSFNRSRGYDADSYLTEFMVFYRSSAKDDAESTSSSGMGGIIDAEIVEGGSNGLEGMGMRGAEDDREYYCSRTSRLYDANDGSLMQGSTAFFSMKQAFVDSMEP